VIVIRFFKYEAIGLKNDNYICDFYIDKQDKYSYHKMKIKYFYGGFLLI